MFKYLYISLVWPLLLYRVKKEEVNSANIFGHHFDDGHRIDMSYLRRVTGHIQSWRFHVFNCTVPYGIPCIVLYSAKSDMSIRLPHTAFPISQCAIMQLILYAIEKRTPASIYEQYSDV